MGMKETAILMYVIIIQRCFRERIAKKRRLANLETYDTFAGFLEKVEHNKGSVVDSKSLYSRARWKPRISDKDIIMNMLISKEKLEFYIRRFAAKY